MTGDRRKPISAAILAAGRSSRFGAPKLLAPVGDRPLIRATVESLLLPEFDDVLVVVGHQADRVREALRGLPIRFEPNPRYRDGIGTSVAAAVAALPDACAAVLIALGDQPLFGSDVPAALIAAYRAGGGPIVAPEYAGVRGNPVIFDASVFPEMIRLDDDEGARGIIARSPSRTTIVRFDVAPPPDVDTPSDLVTLERGAHAAGGAATRHDDDVATTDEAAPGRDQIGRPDL